VRGLFPITQFSTGSLRSGKALSNAGMFPSPNPRRNPDPEPSKMVRFAVAVRRENGVILEQGVTVVFRASVAEKPCCCKSFRRLKLS
jgi:hypothetical protein